SFVRPRLKVHRLGRPNTNEYSQHFHAGRPLRHCGIEAVPALLDCRKMEPGRVGDRLKEIRIVQIIVGPGNSGVLSSEQSWYRLRKRKIGIEIRVIGPAAVTG